MPMDAVFLHGLTQELAQSLTGARIDKVQQPERDLLLLSVRTQSGNAKLLVHGQQQQVALRLLHLVDARAGQALRQFLRQAVQKNCVHWHVTAPP